MNTSSSVPDIVGISITSRTVDGDLCTYDLVSDGRLWSSDAWVFDQDRYTLTNTCRAPLHLERIELLLDCSFSVDRLYCQKKMMADGSWIETEDGRYTSYYLIAGEADDREQAYAIGFDDLSRWFAGFTCMKRERRIEQLTAFIEGQSQLYESGVTQVLPSIGVFYAPSLFTAQQQYARRVAEIMGSRTASIPSGWCSWYYYYDTLSSADLWENVDALREQRFDTLGVSVIQIDDGWNLPHSNAEKVWGDWDAGALFPEGMKAAADRIHQQGFKAGLWLAPFCVAPESRVFKDHPDWCLQHKGRPAEIYGIHALDLSRQEVRDHIREIFHRVFHQWGYDYVKLDFLHFAIEQGERADWCKTPVETLRQTMQIIREEAGEKFVLGCGAPFGALVGMVDGMRTGHDISSRWDLGCDPKGVQGPYISVKIAAHQTLMHQWMHRIWWANDPDCFITRDYAPEAEKQLFRTALKQYPESIPYGLSLSEAQLWRDLIWMTGTMCLIGENMSELKGERLELLRSVFMQYGGEVELIGPADNSSFVLAGRSGTDGVDTLVLVNLSDSTRAFSPVQLLERQYTLPPRSSLIIENTGNNRGRI